MNKTVLIIIGLACALLTAWGVMHWTQYDNPYEILRFHSQFSGEVRNGQKTIPEIIKLLSNNNKNVKIAASWVLFNYNSKEALPELRKLLRVSNSYDLMRITTISNLAFMKDKESIPEIRKLLDDKPGCEIAISALGELGDKESIPKIRELINGEYWGVRRSAIEALVKLGDKESIPLINKSLKDEDKNVRKAAEEALKKLGVPEAEIEKAKEGK